MTPQALALSQARYDRLRSDFVAAASHELKTPVAAIEVLSETLLMALDDGDMASAAEFAGQIKGESKRLRKLVEELLDLARFEENPQAVSVCDLRRVAETAVMIRKRLVEERGLYLHVTGVLDSGDEPLLARISDTDATIVLDNLLDNALSYTDAGGITVGIEPAAEGAAWQVSVRDTGIGIAADQYERIFERFYRVDRSRSRQRGGTGLGLALVKNAVTRRGGSVALTSAPGIGSTFTVTLPSA